MDLLPGQGEWALLYLGLVGLCTGVVEVPVVVSFAFLYLPPPGENLPKTCPGWMAFLPSFSLCVLAEVVRIF